MVVEKTNHLNSRRLPTIAVTLFDEQVVRNYLINGAGSFFRDIGSVYKVLILTRSELLPVITEFLLPIRDLVDYRIYEISIPRSTFSYRILSLLARSLNHSSSNAWSIRRRYARGEISYLAKILRLQFNRAFSKNRAVIFIVRYIFKYNHGISDSDCEILVSQKIDLFFLTSATNFDWDSRIGSFCNRKRLKLICTPRSWDNLTSHGIMRYEPDIICVFTEAMKKHVKELHFFRKAEVQVIQSPAYQYLDSKKDFNGIRKPTQLTRILYACTGSLLYPDEVSTLYALHEYCATRVEKVEVFILEHPKFRYPREVIEDLPTFKWACFPYSKQKEGTGALLSLLKTCDVILSAGSSIALDALSIGKLPISLFIEHFAFEGRYHWLSISRYRDSVQHFYEFIDEVKPKVITDLSELYCLLDQSIGRTQKNAPVISVDHLQFYFGLGKGKLMAKVLNSMVRIN